MRRPSAIIVGSRQLRAGVLCALAIGMVGACSDSTTATGVTDTTKVTDTSTATDTATAGPGPAAQMTKAAGDNQGALPNSVVPVPPAVRVSDASGSAVSGVHVHFAVAAGGGSVTRPDATTDSNGVAAVGSWKLGATSGNNQLSASAGQGLSATFTAVAGEYSPDITPVVGRPQPDTIVGDTLPVSVTVKSRYELASVRAHVDSVAMDLSFSTQDNRWEGTLLLHGLPRDTLQLVVTATDVNGSATDAFVSFVHDRKPTLTVTVPAIGAVARPSIDLSVDCADDDPAGCRSLVVAVSHDQLVDSLPLATGQSHIGGRVSLAGFDGRKVDLAFTATDSRGQVVRVFRTVSVESSAKLSEITTVDGLVGDFRGDHVLYRGADGMIALRDVTSGATQVIYADTGARSGSGPPYGYVTSTGAIFAVSISAFPYARALEWRNGTLVDLGGVFGSSLRVSGDYAIFSNGTYGNTLMRRDLVTGTNTTISTSAGNTQNDVAPNGDVAFWGTDYRVYRYRNGTTTLLTPDDGTGLWNTYPLTDGVNVAYRKSTPCCNAQNYSIALHDISGETILAPARPHEPAPGWDYALNAGWTAFTTLGGGVMQVWTRSPTGELRQVSFFGTDSRISSLASDGTVIFQNGTRRYLAAPGGAPEDIMSNLGTVIWCDGRFVALIGGTAFAITP